MNERRKILEEFEKNKEFMDVAVSTGIERYRKGTARIKITDKDGNPVKNAKVKAVQKNHEFRFGANLFMLDELETKEKNDKYKKAFTDVFNMATLPFYWDCTEPEEGKTRYAKDSEKMYRRPPIDLCMEFCEKNGIEPREHALAYENFFPEWLYDKSVFEIKKHFEKRCKEISERYGDRISTIEVTNEMDWPQGRTAFYEEPDYVEWCFKTAEKYFPGNELVINECGIPWVHTGRVTDQYYSYIEANLLKGARIDAIGMQFHMFFKQDDEYKETRRFYDPKRLYKCMDMYSNFGKPLQITEITIPAYSNDEEDEALQAEILEKLYSIWFSHPNVEQIIYWNLVDGYAHVRNPDPEKVKKSQGDMTLGENVYYGGLLRFDMSPKPAYYAIKNLIEKEWHTETELETNENGEISYRGFYGEYDLAVTVGEENLSKNIKLSSKGSNEFILAV